MLHRQFAIESLNHAMTLHLIALHGRSQQTSPVMVSKDEAQA
jgi:hypothetical protein